MVVFEIVCAWCGVERPAVVRCWMLDVEMPGARCTMRDCAPVCVREVNGMDGVENEHVHGKIMQMHR